MLGPQRITAKLGQRSGQHCVMDVGSELVLPLLMNDYGRNRRNLDRLRGALIGAGFTVMAEPMKVSWLRSSRP